METDIKITAKYILDRIGSFKPEIGLILGSGLGGIAELIETPTVIPYSELRAFPVSSVPGHANNLVAGYLEAREVVMLQGRFHIYEGFSAKDIAKPIKVLKEIGVKKLIITNAAGGLNPTFSPGDIMIISDHINLMGDNPLKGTAEFVDLTNAYPKKLRDVAREAGLKVDVVLREGVYVAMQGPSYETPAEVRFLQRIGGDAVGMSTVPEVITAVHLGIEVLALSLITNLAAGVSPEPLSHEEVMEVAQKTEEKFKKLILEIVKKI